MALHLMLVSIQLMLFSPVKLMVSYNVKSWTTRASCSKTIWHSLSRRHVNVAGGDWTTFNPPESWPRRQRRLVYGANEVPVAEPNFILLLVAELLRPLFLFQVCVQCVGVAPDHKSWSSLIVAC